MSYAIISIIEGVFMKRFLLFFTFVISFLYGANICYAEELDIYSKSAILYNMDDDIILYEKNSEERTSIASLTKIMTCIIAIENIDNLDQKIILKSDVFTGLAEAGASVAGFRVGENVTFRDLLMGALLPSGADATRALALNISGSESEFVNLMNKKAIELGLKNTHFENTTGLESSNHYSTVKDISIILKYALKNQTFKDMYTTREYTTTSNLTFYSTLKKISNNYSFDVSNILGSKTGYTDEAGLCMSSIANYNGVNYLLVTAGADYRGNVPRQLLDAMTIYNFYSTNYGYKNIINTGDYIKTINEEYSTKEKYDITSPITISKFLNNSFNEDKIKYEYSGLDKISYKNKIGDKLGSVNIIYDDNIIDTFDVFLTETINFSLLTFLLQTKLIYLIGATIIILLIIICFFKKRKDIKKKS